MSNTGYKKWHFHGGLHLPDHKALSTQQPIRQGLLPQRLVVPMQQHIGDPNEPVVKEGDYVLKGQVIAQAAGYISAPVHAPTSGTVTHIGEQPVPHPSGLSAPCITLRSDGQDQWIAHAGVGEDYVHLAPHELRNLVRQAGIVGLGGAAFPTAVKLNPGKQRPIHTLIVNAVECEPYITCDDMLMRERAADIVSGIQIFRHAIGAEHCLIGIEDNKPEAIEALRMAIASVDAHWVHVVTIPTHYPSGGEKQLIKVLTGQAVPSGQLPADIGMVCHNVGTLYALHKAIIYGQPLISRIVTVTGRGVVEACNIEALIGTPMDELIAQCGGYSAAVSRLVMGGPMMGFALRNDHLPVTKATNCLLLLAEDEVEPQKPAVPCIRCGACADVCPAHLLPQQLYWYTQAKDFDKVKDYHLFDCIECGCCSYVCPSNIPLVHYYRYAKTEIANAERERKKSDIARERYEFRATRLEREKQEKEARLAQKRAALAKKAQSAEKGADVIEQAVARAKAKKQTEPQDHH